MEAYTSTLGLLTDSLISLHNALLYHLKLVPGSRTCFLFNGAWNTVNCPLTQVDFFKLGSRQKRVNDF